MAYEMYMGNLLCPITPSKLEVKIKNQNKTMNLINGEEVNVLKNTGLTEISYDLLLPNAKYPFATYKSNVFVDANFFLKEFKKMKTEKKPFQFKVIRTLPNGNHLFDTDMTVSLEDYTIKEDAQQGFDVVVSIKLKQFRYYGTKTVTISESTSSTSTSESASESTSAEAKGETKEEELTLFERVRMLSKTRETSNSPEPPKNTVKTHTVVKGDSLWNIAKKYYGDGSKYNLILEVNKDKIKNANSIYPGQVLTIPNASDAIAQTTTSTTTTTTTTKKSTAKKASFTKPSASTKPSTSTPKVVMRYAGKLTRDFLVGGQSVYFSNLTTINGVKYYVKNGKYYPTDKVVLKGGMGYSFPKGTSYYKKT